MTQALASRLARSRPLGDKSNGVVQIIMLSFLMAGMGWTVKATVENGHTLARFEEVFHNEELQMLRVNTELQRLQLMENVFEHRVTALESKKTP